MVVETPEQTVEDRTPRNLTTEDPAAEAAGLPPAVPTAGSGIVARTAPSATAPADDDDDYDISGYDLSRYEPVGTNGVEYATEPLQLTGADDPDAAEDDDEDGDDDEPVGAGAGGRRRSRRGGARRRTRP